MLLSAPAALGGSGGWGTDRAQSNGLWSAWLDFRVVPGTELNRAQTYEQKLYIQGPGLATPKLVFSQSDTYFVKFWLNRNGVLVAQGRGQPSLFFPGQEPILLQAPQPKSTNNWSAHNRVFLHFDHCWLFENALLYESTMYGGADLLLGLFPIDIEKQTVSPPRICFELTGKYDLVQSARVYGDRVLCVGTQVFWQNAGYDNSWYPNAVKATWGRSKLRLSDLANGQMLSGNEVPEALLRVNADALERVFGKEVLERARAHRDAGAPVLQGDRLIFTPPGAKRLLCINLEGQKLWERTYDRPVRAFAGPSPEALLQEGNAISLISVDGGELQPKFTVEDEHDEVTFSIKAGGFISRNVRDDSHGPKLLDESTGKVLWRTDAVEDILCGMSDTIVSLHAQPSLPPHAYSVRQNSLEGYDRTTHSERWRVIFWTAPHRAFLPAAFKPPYLVYAQDRCTLATINCATGSQGLARHVELADDGYIGPMTFHGEEVVWVTTKPNPKDPTNSEHTLHFSTVPKFVEQRSIVLKAGEFREISFEEGFIMADSLYRTACFGPGGDKVWERRQRARTRIHNNRMYFSDNDANTASVGFIDVPTGRETILWRGPVR
jgi:hypothetical protein